MPITYCLPQHWLYAEEQVETHRRVLLLLWPNKRNILVPRGSQLINHWSFWIHPTVNINQIHLALWNVLTILSPPANWEPMRYSHSNRYPSLFSVRFDSVAEDKHVSIQGTYSSTSALALFAFLARGYVDTRTRGRGRTGTPTTVSMQCSWPTKLLLYTFSSWRLNMYEPHSVSRRIRRSRDEEWCWEYLQGYSLSRWSSELQIIRP